MRERRNSVRHKFTWPATFAGNDADGITFAEEGNIENLSATGTYFYFTRLLSLGARLNLAIRLPGNKDNWMTYSGEVVRIEPAIERAGVAVKFATVKPHFVSR